LNQGKIEWRKKNHCREIDRICQNLGIEKTHQWLWTVIVALLSLIISTIKAGKVQKAV
jgi:hypothetical protein